MKRVDKVTLEGSIMTYCTLESKVIGKFYFVIFSREVGSREHDSWENSEIDVTFLPFHSKTFEISLSCSDANYDNILAQYLTTHFI